MAQKKLSGGRGGTPLHQGKTLDSISAPSSRIPLSLVASPSSPRSRAPAAALSLWHSSSVATQHQHRGGGHQQPSICQGLEDSSCSDAVVACSWRREGRPLATWQCFGRQIPRRWRCLSQPLYSPPRGADSGHEQRVDVAAIVAWQRCTAIRASMRSYLFGVFNLVDPSS